MYHILAPAFKSAGFSSGKYSAGSGGPDCAGFTIQDAKKLRIQIANQAFPLELGSKTCRLEMTCVQTQYKQFNSLALRSHQLPHNYISYVAAEPLLLRKNMESLPGATIEACMHHNLGKNYTQMPVKINMRYLSLQLPPTMWLQKSPAQEPDATYTEVCKSSGS